MATVWVVDAYRATTYFVEPSSRYGMVVTDSFPMVRGPEEWQEYAMRLVRAVYDRTGQVIVMMVLPGGGGLFSATSGGRYTPLLMPSTNLISWYG